MSTPSREAESRSTTSYARPARHSSGRWQCRELPERSSASRPACRSTAPVRARRRLQGVLVLRPADAVFHRQVLHRLQVQGDARYRRQPLLQPRDDLRRACLALLARLQVDLDAPASSAVVLVPSMPMNEDRLSTSGSCRMFFASCLLQSRHCLERHRLRRLGDAQDHARVLHREKSLRHRVASTKVSTRVATVTTSVAVWCRKTQRSVRP